MQCLIMVNMMAAVTSIAILETRECPMRLAVLLSMPACCHRWLSVWEQQLLTVLISGGWVTETYIPSCIADAARKGAYPCGPHGSHEDMHLGIILHLSILLEFRTSDS